MKQEAQHIPVDEIRNHEEVRIYRLHIIEENQIRVLEKINELENKIEIDYTEKISSLDKRVSFLEKRNNTINKFIWLVIGETLTIIGAVILFIAQNNIGV